MRLRLAWFPLLGCEAQGPGGPRTCTLEPWTMGPWTFHGCLVDDPTPLRVDVPWVAVRVEPDPAGPVRVRISARPSPAPLVLMLLAWLAAVVVRATVLRRRAGEARP